MLNYKSHFFCYSSTLYSLFSVILSSATINSTNNIDIEKLGWETVMSLNSDLKLESWRQIPTFLFFILFYLFCESILFFISKFH